MAFSYIARGYSKSLDILSTANCTYSNQSGTAIAKINVDQLLSQKHDKNYNNNYHHEIYKERTIEEGTFALQEVDIS